MDKKIYTQTAFIPFKKDISQERQEFMSHNWNRIDVRFDASKMTLEKYEAEFKKQLEEKIEMVEANVKYASDKVLKKYSTKLITAYDDFCGSIDVVECCEIGPITSENFCSNCGRKIMR